MLVDGQEIASYQAKSYVSSSIACGQLLIIPQHAAE